MMAQRLHLGLLMVRAGSRASHSNFFAFLVVSVVTMMAVVMLAIMDQIIALKAIRPDHEASQPTDYGNSSENAPSQQLALELYTGGDGKQSAGDEGANTPPGRRQGLGDAVERSKYGV